MPASVDRDVLRVDEFCITHAYRNSDFGDIFGCAPSSEEGFVLSATIPFW
jgi:hypothetical protein